MRYLCLVHQQAVRLAGLCPDDRRAFEEECREYEDCLRRAGHILACGWIEPGAAGTLVRVRGARLSVTSGPPPESPEMLGALFLLEARDLNEAILLAARNPSARVGTIEIRPLRDALECNDRHPPGHRR